MEGTTTGSFNEMTVLNGIPLTAEQQLDLADVYGGAATWGGAGSAPHLLARGLGPVHAVPMGQAGRIRILAGRAIRWLSHGRSELPTKVAFDPSSLT